MKHLTQEIPKPMLPVHGRPILEHILLGLKSSGFPNVCIVTGWHGDAIRSHFGDGRALGLSIDYGRQEIQDGTGRAPEPARSFVGPDPFLLTYGDILVRPETYEAMRRRWERGDADGLVTVIGAADVAQGGLNVFDSEFNLRRIVEKPSPAELETLRREGWLKPGDKLWYNAGIYIFRPVLFEFIDRLEKSPRGEYELTDAIGGMVAAGRRVAGLEIAGRWVDVRDPQVLDELQREAVDRSHG